MRSAPHFWALFFHWQALLLHKVRTTRHTAHERTAHAEPGNHAPQAEEVRGKARAQGRKWDVVWEDVNIKHGIMERNYIDHFQKRDNIIRTRFAFLLPLVPNGTLPYHLTPPEEIGAEHFVVISGTSS